MLWATHVHTWAYTLIIKFVNVPFQNLNKKCKYQQMRTRTPFDVLFVSGVGLTIMVNRGARRVCACFLPPIRGGANTLRRSAV